MSESTTLPDNLKSRLARVYVANKSFKNDAGETISYSRLVLQGEIKGEKFEIETKLEQKDITLLKFSDIVENSDFKEQE